MNSEKMVLMNQYKLLPVKVRAMVRRQFLQLTGLRHVAFYGKLKQNSWRPYEYRLMEKLIQNAEAVMARQDEIDEEKLSAMDVMEEELNEALTRMGEESGQAMEGGNCYE